MTDRRCGYCRIEGHTRAKCEILAWQKDTILKVVPQGRKWLHDRLINAGIGVGAIVRVADNWSGEKVEAIIPTMDFFRYETGIAYRKRRRLSSVQAIFGLCNKEYRIPDMPVEGKYGSYQADYLRLTPRYDHRIPVYKLSDMGETLYGLIITDTLERGGLYEPADTSWREVELVSPSHDTDATDDMFLHGVPLHERITGKGLHYARGIKTW